MACTSYTTQVFTPVTSVSMVPGFTQAWYCRIHSFSTPGYRAKMMASASRMISSRGSV